MATFTSNIPMIVNNISTMKDVSAQNIELSGNLFVSGSSTLSESLDVDGNVGIGGDSSSEKLKVYGDVNITGNINVDGSFSFSEVVQNTTTINNTLLVSTQLDVSNQGTGPALKVSQLGDGDDQDVALFNAGDEGDALKIDSSGNTFVYKDVTVSGALNANGGIKCDTNKFVVADGTGNTTIAGTLGVTGALTATGGINADGFTVADGTGNTKVGNTLFIGTNDNSTTSKTIKFGGTAGDNNYEHSVIETRVYAGSEQSELLLFKGADVVGSDRIRLRGAQIDFDTYPSVTTNRTAENIRMSIKSNGNVDILGGLEVGGSATIAGTLGVTGALTANGGISADGFSVSDGTGSTSISGSLAVSGVLTATGGGSIYTQFDPLVFRRSESENGSQNIAFNLRQNGQKVLIHVQGNSWGRGTIHFCFKDTVGGTNDGDIATISDSKARIYPNGAFQAVSITPTSDDRLKKNETFITNAIQTISKLRPQTYDKYSTLKCDDGYIVESGLIAQEIYYDVPELRHLVTVSDDADISGHILTSEDPSIDPDYSSWGSSPAGVNYSGLTAYLIKAIQEQQDIINEEKEKNQTQYNDLLTRIKALES